MKRAFSGKSGTIKEAILNITQGKKIEKYIGALWDIDYMLRGSEIVEIQKIL